MSLTVQYLLNFRKLHEIIDNFFFSSKTICVRKKSFVIFVITEVIWWIVLIQLFLKYNNKQITSNRKKKIEIITYKTKWLSLSDVLADILLMNFAKCSNKTNAKISSRHRYSVAEHYRSLPLLSKLYKYFLIIMFSVQTNIFSVGYFTKV